LPITWLESRDLVHFHKELISDHGGLFGTPRQTALESTLARPQNLYAYDPSATIFQLAASYGYGLARNHCFPDGNKRIALAAMDVFLAINGAELVASEPDAVVTIRSLAAGEMTEDELAQWVKANASSA
jgi:death-on-curing protein